jgi:putative oxidoreductase
MLWPRMDRHQVSLGLLFLRLAGGALLIQWRAPQWSAMLNTTRAMVSNPLGISGEFDFFLTLFSELICTILVMLGIFTKFTAVPPLVVMLVMALAMPASTAWSTREIYLLHALPFFILTFTGPGDYSIDGRVSAWANPR